MWAAHTGNGGGGEGQWEIGRDPDAQQDVASPGNGARWGMAAAGVVVVVVELLQVAVI